MPGQRQLHQNAVDGGVVVQALDQVEKLALRRRFRQVMLNGVKTAFLGLAALGSDIDLACRVFADNHHCNTGHDAGCSHELFGLGLHRGNHILGELLAINQLGHSERSVHSGLSGKYTTYFPHTCP